MVKYLTPYMPYIIKTVDILYFYYAIYTMPTVPYLMVRLEHGGVQLRPMVFQCADRQLELFVRLCPTTTKSRPIG